MTALIKYDTACRALAEARRVDEVKDIRDKAIAMQAYGRQAKNKDLEADATEIRMRATRRLGEIMAEMPKAVGSRNLGGSSENPPDVPTLEEQGVDKHLAHNARKFAALSEEQFETAVGEAREAVTIASRRAAARAAQVHTDFVPEIIDGKFNVIVIDPPWDMKRIERDVSPEEVGFDYPTMSEEEIAALPIPSLTTDDCHVYLWTTQKFEPMARRLFERWGITPILLHVWHKTGGFQPFGLPQYNCEFVLYGRRGTPKFVDLKDFFCCFEAPRRQHSRKPDKFYDDVRRVTAGRRLDMFAREPRDGFETWGNETDKFEATPPQEAKAQGESWGEMWAKPFDFSKIGDVHSDEAPSDDGLDIPEYLKRAAP